MWGYPGIVCATPASFGRDLKPGCEPGVPASGNPKIPLPYKGCDCAWPGDGGNWTDWDTMLTAISQQASNMSSLMWDVWNEPDHPWPNGAFWNATGAWHNVHDAAY